MWKSVCKWCNWQRISLKNIQGAHAAQYQKNQTTQSKMGGRPKETFLQGDKLTGVTWKDAQRPSLWEKCKSKQQWGITSHQSEQSSSKNLQTIDAGEGVEEREPSCTVSGIVNWYSRYGRQYGDSLRN